MKVDATELKKRFHDLSGKHDPEPDPEKLSAVEQQTKEILIKSFENVAPIVENYRENITTEKELLQVKDYYYRKKYLQRILDKIYQIRNIASHL